MSMSITDLPLEIINRITTIGCEDIHTRGALRPVPRRLKRFAVTASLVCKEWHALVHAPSNYHLWHTLLTLFHFAPDSGDIARDISQFANLLLGSQLSDLDLMLVFPGPELETDDRLVERLMLHALSLLFPYHSQIRSIRIESQPRRAILSILNALESLPRLVLLSLESSAEESVISPHDGFPFEESAAVLDLCSEENFREVTLLNWGVIGEMRFPTNIHNLTFCMTNGSSIGWNDIARHLKWQSHLVSADLGPIAPIDTALSSSSNAVGCELRSSGVYHLKSLRSLMLQSDIVSIYKLMVLLDVPSLAELHLTTVSSGSGGSAGGAAPAYASPRKLFALKTLQLFINEACWTITHDCLVRDILSSHLESVAIDLMGATITCSPLSPTTPPSIISNLRLNLYRPQPNWVALLSRWDPETLSIHHEITHKDAYPAASRRLVLPTSDDTLSMQNLHTLSFYDAAAKSLDILLSRLNAPRLRELELNSPSQFQLSSAIASETAKQIQTLRLSLGFAIGFPDIMPYISSFPNIRSFDFTPKVSHTCLPLPDFEGSISGMLELAELVVAVHVYHMQPPSEMSPEEKSLARERRRSIEDTLRDSMTTIVRIRTGNDYRFKGRAKLKAQLYVREVARGDDIGLVWSSESM